MVRRNLHEMTMAELAEEARRVGIPSVEHMSTEEIVEAIEQQREANDLLPADGDDHASGQESSMPPGWENFRGSS
ncbi:hypothetical protein B0I33_104455 [Prauserella shujinwangii]|uniref:Rho termination factor-like N-terminal domain-containing protein n=1 Tax=Prauserella shujinwangii TaxID=1453103 RepID=A0A2T0LX89_9PSEU|nr:Rho termination factor N-terminal domain-containing protein [Prauserella shujinwangii]PRX48638.1 hypothetical protein B0I33_104455 [Prauserella shujinwangii]